MSTFELPWTRRGSEARAPGAYTRQSVLRLRMRCLITLGLFAVFTGLMGRLFGLHEVVFELSEVVLLCACFAVTRWALPVVERYDRGATAEEYVGMLLASLDERWRVLHDVELSHGNVDHVVLGPAGLFTVETKSNPGPVRVHRLHGRIIRQAHEQREEVQRAVGDVRVEALVVFTRAFVDHPGRRRKGVRVLAARMLVAYLNRRPERLTPDRVEDLHRRLVDCYD